MPTASPFLKERPPDETLPRACRGGRHRRFDRFLLDAQDRRQLVLVKNGHRYVFRYERGEETKVLAGLVEMARDPKSELDWFDAAVLSHQLGQRMSEQLDRLRRA